MTVKKSIFLLCFCLLLLAACKPAAGGAQATRSPGAELTPYVTNTSTPTSTATSTSQVVPTDTQAPTPTATPLVYTVKENDTMFDIAYFHGVTVAELKAANPTINPYLLSKGMTLIIPSSQGGETAATGVPAAQTTLYPLTVSDPQCTASLTGGMYCFADLTNNQQSAAGSLSLEFHLTNPQSGEVLSEQALVPLNRLNTGESLPLFAYFAPPVFSDPLVTVELKTSSGLQDASAQQAAVVRVDHPQVEISANGLSAMVSGKAQIEAAEGTSGKVWIAAVAYDANGKTVAIRRFISDAAYSAGEAAPFTLNLYSVGGKIDRVEFFGEVNS